jgi:hypothetical protein
MTERVGLLLVLAALAVACDKKDEEGRPSGVPPSQAAAPPAAPTPPPPPAALPPPAAPPAAPAAEAPPADRGGSITGEVVLAPSQKANVKSDDVIFLVARRISDNPSARGSLIAVKKLSAATFPIPFTLSAADMPFENGAFEGELTLTARVDKDRNPMTRLKGDVVGTIPKIKVGAKGVKLRLSELQKEDESLAQPGGPMGGPMMPPGHP